MMELSQKSSAAPKEHAPPSSPERLPLPPRQEPPDDAVIVTGSSRRSQLQQQQQQQQGDDDETSTKTQPEAAAAIAIATSEPAPPLSENDETMPEPSPPRPHHKSSDSMVAAKRPASTTSLQLVEGGNELTAATVASPTVTASVCKKKIAITTSTTQPPPTETTTTITNDATTKEVMAGGELEERRQAGLLQRKWEEMFARLEFFRSKHGHCLVPNRYPDDPQLGSWVSTQRRQYKIMVTAEGGGNEATPMTPARAARLEAVGFQWSTNDPRHVSWQCRYEQLVQFRDKYGHSQVPIGWEENIPLSNWVSTQRQEYKLLQKGRSSRLNEERIAMLDKVEMIWEAQRGGPRRKRKATVAVPPKATPVELIGPNNIRQHYYGGTTPGGLSLLGGVADLPLFVNIGMNAAVMQAAAAAAASAPHWAMMGHGAFQASPLGSPPAVQGVPLGVFPNAMLFPMAHQSQMPWAMAAMTRYGVGRTVPSFAGTPSTPTDATPVDPATPSGGTSGTPKVEGASPYGGAKTDSTTPAAFVDTVEAPCGAATIVGALTLPVAKSSAQVLINTTESPPQAPEAQATGWTTDSGGVQTTALIASDEHVPSTRRPLLEPYEATPVRTETTKQLTQQREANVTASDEPTGKDAPPDLP